MLGLDFKSQLYLFFCSFGRDLLFHIQSRLKTAPQPGQHTQTCTYAHMPQDTGCGEQVLIISAYFLHRVKGLIQKCPTVGCRKREKKKEGHTHVRHKSKKIKNAFHYIWTLAKIQSLMLILSLNFPGAYPANSHFQEHRVRSNTELR